MEWYNLVGIGFASVFGPIAYAVAVRNVESLQPWNPNLVAFAVGMVLIFV